MLLRIASRSVPQLSGCNFKPRQLQEAVEIVRCQRCFKSSTSVSFLPPPPGPPFHPDNHDNRAGRNISRPNFDDFHVAHGSKSTAELLRAIIVSRLCQVPFLVKNASSLLNVSRRFVMGDSLTDKLLRETLYGQFCGGTDTEALAPLLHQLQMDGVGGILDFAAENEQEVAKSGEGGIFDPAMEKQLNSNVSTFLECIKAASLVSSAAGGFAAVKLTGLANPELLELLSTRITHLQQLFQRLEKDRDGCVSVVDVRDALTIIPFPLTVRELRLEEVDPHLTGKIDSIAWNALWKVQDLPPLQSVIPRNGGEPSIGVDQEMELVASMLNRATTLAKEASSNGITLLIDAEQSRTQPAIDKVVLQLQQQFNKVCENDTIPLPPTIFNTYQCYLKDSKNRVKNDLESSRRYGYSFGAKLVRGAYMERERGLAQSHGRPSPIHETKDETHRCYNETVTYLLSQMKNRRTDDNDDKYVHLMCATHNRASLELAVDKMESLGIAKDDPRISFAQLLGMSDNLTVPLGKEGYQVYKYIPYGPVKETIAYLVRRMEENASMLEDETRNQVERVGLEQELKGRLTCFYGYS